MSDITYTLLVNQSPAPQEILEKIQEIQVESSVGIADAFRITFAVGQSDKDDWTLLEDDSFKPLTPITIKMQIGSGLSETIMNGYISSQRVSISNEPGASTVEVLGMDASVLMNLEEKILAWPDMSDSVIATTIFNQYGFKPDVDQTQPTWQSQETTTMQRGTDMHFLQKLARRNGFECFIESDHLTNMDVGHFHKPKLQKKAQGVLSVSFGEKTNVMSFRIRYNMLQPTKAHASTIDIHKQSVEKVKVETPSTNPLGQEGLKDRMTKTTLVYPSRTGLTKTSELQTLCQAIVDRSTWAVVAEGELNTAVYGGVLRAHRLVNVRGVGKMYSGQYYVHRVLHTFSGEDYKQQFELRRNAVGLIGSEDFKEVSALA